MTTDTLHPRAVDTGQFVNKSHSAPELSFEGAGQLAGSAVSLIRNDAPIGARTAEIRFDDELGTLAFGRYADEYGRSVPASPSPLVSVALTGVYAEDFATVPGVEVAAHLDQTFTLEV